MKDMLQQRKKKPFRKSTMFMYWGVRIITIILFSYSIVGIFLHRSDDSQMGDYTFIAINALSLFLLSFLPSIVYNKLHIFVPEMLLRIYLAFVTAALLFGEIFRFFVYISWWDSALHLFSGSMIGVVGFSFIDILNRVPNRELKLSPGFIAIFVFCFSLAVGVIWEIIEYACDALVSTSNMQRFRDSITGELWVGRQALRDTMKDFILNTIGALIISVLGFIDLIRKTGWMRKISLYKQRKFDLHNQPIISASEDTQISSQ